MNARKETAADARVIELDVTGITGVVGVVLVLAAVLGYFAWGESEANAEGSSPAEADKVTATADLRQFYLTPALVTGATALGACEAGYHMASLWEILDPSGLVYNTNLGQTQPDSGSGPPTTGGTIGGGFVRTGHLASDPGTYTTGQANCNAWTDGTGLYWGTAASLQNNWTTGTSFFVWNVSITECNSSNVRVWCVED